MPMTQATLETALPQNDGWALFSVRRLLHRKSLGCVVNSDTGKSVIMDESRLTVAEFEKIKIAETSCRSGSRRAISTGKLMVQEHNTTSDRSQFPLSPTSGVCR